MIMNKARQEDLPKEISENFEVFQEIIKKHLKTAELEEEKTTLKDLASEPTIVQLLHCDSEHFKQFMETFEDVVSVDKDSLKKIQSIGQNLQGLTDKSRLQKGAKQIRSILCEILKNEIEELDDDEEIKESFDLMKKNSLDLIQKLLGNSDNKENKNRIQNEKKKIAEEEQKKKIEKEIEEKTKQEKDKVLELSKELKEKFFETEKVVEVELVAEEGPLIRRDCPPKVYVEEMEKDWSDLDKLESETGLQILGNNCELREVFSEWENKPMLRVLTNKSKMEIENSIKRAENLKNISENGNTGEGKKREIQNFLDSETKKVEDTVDLFGENDYMFDFYMSGSKFYRDVERRFMFPYSDSCSRFKKSQMLVHTSSFIEEIRRNILCYEREVSKNFSVGDFHRMSEEEVSSSAKVLVVYIFKISDLSQSKKYEMTATFFGLNRKLTPIQGTVSIKR